MIYEYQCKQCEIVFEKQHSIKETPEFFCEHCGSETPLKKLISLSSFILKGGCWEKDLYSSKKPNNKS